MATLVILVSLGTWITVDRIHIVNSRKGKMMGEKFFSYRIGDSVTLKMIAGKEVTGILVELDDHAGIVQAKAHLSVDEMSLLAELFRSTENMEDEGGIFATTMKFDVNDELEFMLTSSDLVTVFHVDVTILGRSRVSFGAEITPDDSKRIIGGIDRLIVFMEAGGI